MRSYEHFASIYDYLMQDVPYEKWVQFIEDTAKNYVPHKENVKLLDIGCGTGETAIKLSSIGFKVTGIDLSEEMLSVARQKIEQTKYTVPLVCQDMRNLEGFQEFNIAVILVDSLNYLLCENDVSQTFNSIYNSLTDQGLLIFDVHTPFKMQEIFKNQVYVHRDEQVSYIWECFEGELPLSIEHDLSFFVKNDEDSSYEKYDEYHYQRTFSKDTYERLLKQCGFHILSITTDFQPIFDEQGERMFFIAQKNRP